MLESLNHEVYNGGNKGGWKMAGQEKTEAGAKRDTRSKNTTIDKILKQRKKNPLMTLTDQAKLNGVSKQALSSLLKRHGVEVNAMEEYKQHRADLFAGKQATVLEAFDSDSIKAMVSKHPMAAVTLFNSLFNNERLERGLSTQNTAVLMASAVLDADKRGAGVTETVTECEVIEPDAIDLGHIDPKAN